MQIAEKSRQKLSISATVKFLRVSDETQIGPLKRHWSRRLVTHGEQHGIVGGTWKDELGQCWLERGWGLVLDNKRSVRNINSDHFTRVICMGTKKISSGRVR